MDTFENVKNHDSDPIVKKNIIWTKGIKITNEIFLVIYLLLIFGLDLYIVISSPELIGFWYIMFGVLALFLIFFYFENIVFNKKFAVDATNLDKGIFAVVIIRNLIFLLNFIPFIQLLGMAAMVFIGWIILFIYLGLINARFRQQKRVSN